jgi:PAS domain S-box-containing protein
MSDLATILVVDDDPGTCQTIGDVLRLRGYSTKIANRGGSALETLSGRGVDLAILDIELPDVSGLELLQSLKKSSPSTEVIIITGHASVPTAVKAIDGSAFAYLTKPFEMDNLLSIVDKALGKQRLERALRDSEERYRLVAEHIQDAIFLLDFEGRVVFANRRGAELTGYTETETRTRPLSSFLTAEGAAETASRLEAARTGRHVEPFFETELVRRDGSRIWVEVNGVNVVTDGQVSGRLAVIRDITARREAEAALRETSQRLQAIVDSVPIAISVVDEAGHVSFWSKAAVQLLGWTEEEIRGRPLPTVPDQRRAEYDAATVRNWRGEATLYETQRQRKDGLLVEVIASVTPLIGPDGKVTGTLGTLVDITDRKHLEEQLRHAVKMEGLGRLAGGVAHDFNNLLTVIGGRTYLLLSRLPADDSMRRDLELIQQTSGRAAVLTRQLLTFSRKQILELTVLDLNELVSEIKSLLERLLGEDVEVVTDLDPALGKVTADHGQIGQVIVNLAINARDAMPGGGRLTLETRNVELDETYTRQHVDVRPGAYVALAVSDTGSGMDEATLARIFEPFFTTKEVGKGTGLGLAMVYGTTKQSNGHIAVESKAGHGTTFRIYLPRTEAAKSAPVEARREASSRGSETVLLAEDDLNLRALAREILESQGYTVLDSGDVDDALRISENYGSAIHLLLTDVVMPRMSGRALAEAVKRHRPDLKVLYMSGYTDDAIVQYGVLDPGTPFLHKPFTPGNLAHKVREVLDGAPLPPQQG